MGKSIRIGLVVTVEIDVRGFITCWVLVIVIVHQKQRMVSQKCRSRRWQRVGVVPGSDWSGGCDFMAIFKLRYESPTMVKL